LAAVLETDNDLMPSRIYEALAAIEQRLLSSMEAIEQRTIDDAQTGLLTLKAERVVEVPALFVKNDCQKRLVDFYSAVVFDQA